MMILRTSLELGNKNVTQALKETKHDKTVTYDKIIANMLDTCYSSIEDKVVNEILRSEKADYWRDEFNSYLKFNKNVFQIIGPSPKLTKSENFIVSEIEKTKKNPTIEFELEEEEEIDFLTSKFGKYKYIALGTTIGFTISFFFMIFFKLFKSK